MGGVLLRYQKMIHFIGEISPFLICGFVQLCSISTDITFIMLEFINPLKKLSVNFPIFHMLNKAKTELFYKHSLILNIIIYAIFFDE